MKLVSAKGQPNRTKNKNAWSIFSLFAMLDLLTAGHGWPEVPIAEFPILRQSGGLFREICEGKSRIGFRLAVLSSMPKSGSRSVTTWRRILLQDARF